MKVKTKHGIPKETGIAILVCSVALIVSLSFLDSGHIGAILLFAVSFVCLAWLLGKDFWKRYFLGLFPTDDEEDK